MFFFFVGDYYHCQFFSFSVFLLYFFSRCPFSLKPKHWVGCSLHQCIIFEDVLLIMGRTAARPPASIILHATYYNIYYNIIQLITLHCTIIIILVSCMFFRCLFSLKPKHWVGCSLRQCIVFNYVLLIMGRGPPASIIIFR